MEKKINLQEKDKKRAAFKRFSQMGAAGLTVISMSAFSNLSAQGLHTLSENDSIKDKNVIPKNMLTDSLEDNYEIRWFDANHYNTYYNYSNYCNYNNNYNNNYSNNYTNYSNTYGNYSNNYSNYSNN